MNEDIITELEQLAKLQDDLTAKLAGFEARRQAILKPVQESLDKLEAEMIAATAELRQTLADRENRIKHAVIAGGQTVKGSVIQAVYVSGRVTWDTKAIDGYAVGHPELFAFRKEGPPSVTIREVKR